MHQQLKHIINGAIGFDDTEWAEVQQAFTILKVGSKHTLNGIADIENKIYFVVKGVIRLYCLNAREEEVTIFLFSENHFASCYHSFLTGTPSDQALETLEECTLLCIDKANLNRLHNQIPKMNILTRIVAEQRFINAQRIFMGHITRTAEERYLDFEKQHSNLLLRVPQNIIASFLGITPVSLSRIRKRVSRK